MSLRKRQQTNLAWANVLCALLLPGVARAQQVTVTPTVTANGTLFEYSYSVFNGAPSELADISFETGARGNEITNTTAPAGFFTTYDGGNGFVSFDPDSDSATPSFTPGGTVAPFTFTSLLGPSQVQFSALDVDGNSYVGMTLAPSIAATPEPSAPLIFGAGALGLALLGARRRRLAGVPAHDRNVTCA